MKKNFFIPLFVLFTLFLGCSEDTPEPEQTGIDLISVGPLQFGGLLVGETRDASIRIINYGPDSIDTSDLESRLSSPFSVRSISSPCNTGSLPAGSNCVLGIRFAPTVFGDFSQDFSMADKSVNTSGKGLRGGLLEIDKTLWEIGSNVAGVVSNEIFTFSNPGNFAIDSPTLSSVVGVTVSGTTCLETINPNTSCTITLESAKTIVGTYDEVVTFSSSQGGSRNVSLSNTITPGTATGLITFNNPVTQMTANGTQTETLTSEIIKDAYGNTVPDGTEVTATSNNLTIIGSVTKQTVNGVVSYDIQSTTNAGNSSFSVFANEASGFQGILLRADLIQGPILVNDYADQVVANGNNQVLVRTLVLKDQFDNVVEDGTKVFFEFIGDATINTIESFTIQGITEVIVRSPVNVGTGILRIKAGEISPGTFNTVTEFPFTFIPGVADGTIPMVSVEDGIYAVQDTILANGSPITSSVTIGPVTDANNNIVLENTSVNVNVTRGQIFSLPSGASTGTFQTDASGMITIDIAGDETRGQIDITSSVDLANGSTSIWAFKDSNVFFSDAEQNMEMRVKFHQDSALPNIDDKYGDVSVSLSKIRISDSSAYGFKKKNSVVPNLFVGGLPEYAWDCFFSGKDKVLTHPCQSIPFSGINSLDYVDEQPVSYLASDVSGSASSTSIPVSGNSLIDSPSGPLNSSSGVFRGTHDFRVNWPSVAYNERLDKGLAFGGAYWQDILDNDIYYKELFDPPGVGGSVGSASDVNTVYTGYERVSGISSSSLDSNTGGLGDQPPAMAAMELVSLDSEFIGFGGLGNSGTGFGYSNLYSFNLNTERWTSLFLGGDTSISESRNPALQNSSGSPSGRYQHEISYIPETKSLYVLSGLEINPDTTAWQNANDIWKINIEDYLSGESLFQNLSWERVCDGDLSTDFCPACQAFETDNPNCGEIFNGSCRNYLGDDIGFSSEPDANPSCSFPNAHSIYSAGGDLNKTYMIWHDAYQKSFIYWAGDPNVREFDPFTDSISSSSRPGILSMANKDQVFFNKDQLRLFSYERGSSSNSNLFFWDMPPGEKTHIQIDVKLGEGSKQFAQEIVPSVRAWGSTNSDTNIAAASGVEIYVYNYDSSTWILWADNNADSKITSANISIPLVNPTEYVSNEGNVSFMIIPKGSANTENVIWVDQLFISGRF